MIILPNQINKYDISDFEFILDLASGSFGTVSLVKNDKFMFTPFAMKVISKKSIIKDAQITHILNEKRILRLFTDIKYHTRTKSDNDTSKPLQTDLSAKEQTKNIVQLYETFQDKENLYFLMEYLPGGELANLF